MSSIQNLLATKNFGFSLSVLDSEILPVVIDDVIDMSNELGRATIDIKGVSAIYEMPFDVFTNNTIAISDAEDVGDELAFYKQEDGTYFLVEAEDNDNTYEVDGSLNFVFRERQLPDTIKLNNISTQFTLNQTGTKTFQLLLFTNNSLGLTLGSLGIDGYNLVFGSPSNLHILYKSLGIVTKSDVFTLEKIVSNPEELIRDFANRNQVIQGQHFYRKGF